jgi:putative spermidine/putrescine transport system permease protein
VARLLDFAFVVMFGVVLAATAVFLVVPIMMTVLMSFDGREYLGRFPPPVLSFRWYTAFFLDSYYMVALRNSAIVSTIAATMATATGVTAAVLLDRYRFRGREALSAFFLSPLVVPTVVMGFSVLCSCRCSACTMDLSGWSPGTSSSRFRTPSARRWPASSGSSGRWSR